MRSYNNFIIDMDVLIKLSKFYIFFIYDKNRMKYKIGGWGWAQPQPQPQNQPQTQPPKIDKQ